MSAPATPMVTRAGVRAIPGSSCAWCGSALDPHFDVAGVCETCAAPLCAHEGCQHPAEHDGLCDAHAHDAMMEAEVYGPPHVVGCRCFDCVS